ncbi:MAG: DinB family protein [Planctomycetes bacterium]|nr:DinB family protein [Planctomycetota bacterium]
MDAEYWRQLFEYDDWANAGHLAALDGADAPGALRAMGHLLAAREIWLLRVKGESAAGLKFFRNLDVAACKALHERVQRDWQAWLRTLTPEMLDAHVTFTDSLGNPYTLTRRVMLTHVLLHSAHHRGQSAMAGHTKTDFDLYLCPLVQA